MFKDYIKYLSTSLVVYLFVLIIIFIMKIVGLDYFGLDMNNEIMIFIENLMSNNPIIKDIVYFIPLLIDQFIILSISSNDNSKKMFRYNVMLIPIFYILQVYKLHWFGNLSFLFEALYFFTVISIYKKTINKEITIRFIKFILFMMFVQLISIFTRLNVSIDYVTSIMANVILNLDYTVILIIAYKIYFMKGDEKICYQEGQFSSLHQQHLLKKQLRKSQINCLNKQEKFEYILYWIFYLIWNIFTLVVILLVALLNHTIIECIFITISFWISKRVFGKAFHLKSVGLCFIVSNLTYYVLNRITTPLGISIFIPILLGVGLSYVTSKFVKKTYKPLYRGMPEDVFEETILKVADKNSEKYKICYDFYIKKKSAVSIAIKYNYTEAGIRKIKDRINEKIKRLD